MHALKILTRILCVIPFATGAMDFFLGTKALTVVNVSLSSEALADPSLNSQLRFFGAIWFGFGLLFWQVAGDLKAHAKWFRLMGFVLILSGIGRLISLMQLGIPAVPLMVAIFVEVVLIPIMLFWHWWLLSKG